MQVEPIKFDSIKNTISKTYHHESVRGFFKGSISNIYVGAGYYSM